MLIGIIAEAGLVVMLTALLWLPVLLLVTLLTPKRLLEKYFKEPHFNSGELVAFSSFPAFFMRTALFCRLYLTPKAVKGRKLYGFVEDSPKWYKISVVVASLGMVIHCIIFILLGGLVYFLDYISR